MRSIPQRLAYLETLRKIPLDHFSAQLSSWIKGTEARTPRVAAPAAVSAKGEVRFRMDGESMVLWGWPLHRSFCGAEVLLVPYGFRSEKLLVIASRDGSMWLTRAYDPEHGLFWAKARTPYTRARIYTLEIPAHRILHVFGVELLLSGHWKPGGHMRIWRDKEKIIHFAGRLEHRHRTGFREVTRDGKISQILVGQGVYHALIKRITGWIDGIKLVRASRMGLYFTLGSQGDGIHCIAKEDAETLNVQVGSTVRVLFERGWPCIVENAEGVRVVYRTVRNPSGTLIFSARRRIPAARLPPLAIIENIVVGIIEKHPGISLLCGRFILPRHKSLTRGTRLTVVIWNQRKLLYIRRGLSLNTHERAMLGTLETLLPRLGEHTREVYAETVTFLERLYALLVKGRIKTPGAAYLLHLLREELAHIWDTPPIRDHKSLAIAAGRLRLALNRVIAYAGTTRARVRFIARH